jgi:hypothetical protein
MYLTLNGHALVKGLGTLRHKRSLPRATLRADAQSMGKSAEVVCGECRFQVPVLDRRHWQGTVAFDGSLLKALAMIAADDLFMDVCRVEFIAGRIVFDANLTGPAQIIETTVPVAS